MSTRHSMLILTTVISLCGAGSAWAQADKKVSKEPVTFGALKPTATDEAKAQAITWLKTTGKSDPATQKAFDAIWAQAERPVLDRVADTLALGDADAAKLLREAKDPANAPPQEVPVLLKDAHRPIFYRANLALAYGKALSRRRVYEECLDALKLVKAEEVVDPSAYLFYRAVAEHSLILKEEATRTVIRLLDDVSEVPDRYKMVAVLIAFDMGGWQEKDLGSIARKMDNIERRLELARGGPKTQKIQKEVVARLDEMIKALENQAKGNCNGGACPNGGQAGNNNRPSSPQLESYGGKNSGPGNVDPKKLEQLAQQWGQLPQKDRAEAMQTLTRDMPAKYREVIENYFKKLATSEANKQ